MKLVQTVFISDSMLISAVRAGLWHQKACFAAGCRRFLVGVFTLEDMDRAVLLGRWGMEKVCFETDERQNGARTFRVLYVPGLFRVGNDAFQDFRWCSGRKEVFCKQERMFLTGVEEGLRNWGDWQTPLWYALCLRLNYFIHCEEWKRTKWGIEWL